MDTRNQNTPLKKNENEVSTENKIKTHKVTAGHLESAAKFHLSAAKHHEEGNSEKAIECSNKAQESTNMAIKENEVKLYKNL